MSAYEVGIISREGNASVQGGFAAAVDNTTYINDTTQELDIYYFYAVSLICYFTARKNTFSCLHIVTADRGNRWVLQVHPIGKLIARKIAMDVTLPTTDNTSGQNIISCDFPPNYIICAGYECHTFYLIDKCKSV